MKKIINIASSRPLIGYPIRRIQTSPLGYRLARGVFWSMAGAVISRGLMLAATVLVARMLGKTVYGELGMIQSTVGMFGVFAGFGLGLTATKHVAQFRESDPDRAGRIIGLSGLFAMVTGAHVMATDLRASAALIIAGCAADGITDIHRVYHLDRGYENIEAKLSKLGARIQRAHDI